MVRAMIATALLCSGAAYAADVNFHPEVSLAGEYSDNVVVSPGDGAMGDGSGRLQVVLPVLYSWDTGSFRFSYAPSIERYQDASYLDNDAHRLIFGVDSAPNRQSALHMDLGYRRSLDQGMSSDLLGEDLFLIPPSQRNRLYGTFSYARQVGRRWEWSGTLDGTDLKYDEINRDGIVLEAPEDRSEYGAALGFDFSSSSQTTIGALLRHRSNELEASASEDLQQLGLVWSRILGRGSDLRMELGASNRSGEYIFRGQTMQEAVSETDLFGEIELNRSLRKAHWRFIAAHRPSSGGTLRGTSTDSLVSIGVSGDPSRSWNWTISARYASRDPLDASLEVTDSVGVGGGIEWRPTQFTGYRIGFDYADQNSTSGLEDRSLTRAWFGFVWYPRGPEGMTSEDEG